MALSRGKNTLDIANFASEVSLPQIKFALVKATENHFRIRGIKYAKEHNLDIEIFKRRVSHLLEVTFEEIRNGQQIDSNGLDMLGIQLLQFKLFLHKKAQELGLEDFRKNY
jgi:hypothetical protein